MTSIQTRNTPLAVETEANTPAGSSKALSAVDQRMLHAHAKPGHGADHGKMRGAQDIETVNFGDAGMGDRDPRAVKQCALQTVPRCAVELFAVAKALGDSGRVQDHSGGGHRARQRTTTHFVDARHNRVASVDPRAFV